MRAAALLALALSGCGVAIDGTFDGVPFTPDSTILAVADRHDLLVRGGTILPVRRPVDTQKVHVLLTAARLDPLDDWRRYPVDNLLEIKRELATSDSLLLKDVRLDALTNGDLQVAVIEEGTVAGDFDVAVGLRAPEESVVAAQGIGRKITVTIDPRSINALPRGGSIELGVEVKREREAGQDGEVATGVVNLSFGAQLLPERLSESNLTVAEPIVKCMMELGAARGAQCRNEDALPYVDETGVVQP